MRIDILTLFPGIFDGPFSQSIIKRAVESRLAEINIHNIRDYATDKHRRVDDYSYGGGAGMVMMVEPVARCIEKLKSERVYDDVIFMTPDGEPYKQTIANQLSTKKNIIFDNRGVI